MDVTPLTLTDTLKVLLTDTAARLKGTERRQFMAQVVQSLGRGGAVQAERALGWNPGTIRKGLYELEHGPIHDACEQRGRKPIEAKRPQLLADIQALVEPQTQADPTLTRQRLCTRLSAPEVCRPAILTMAKRCSSLGKGSIVMPSEKTKRARAVASPRVV